MIKKHQSRKYQERSMACAFCAKHFTASNTSKEHVIPNAIGGRKTVRNFICVDCNNSTGADWDNELVNQLRPLCTMLNINRDRGSNRDYAVETINDRKRIIRPDGSMTIAQPVFDKRDLGDKTEIKIQARNMKEFKSIVSGLQKQYPQIDIDEMLRKATFVREYSPDPYEISLNFGGPLTGRSIVKSCLTLAYEAGLTIDNCEHAKSYLLSDGDACFGYFNEYDVVKDRPERTFFHSVYVCGDPARKQVLAYVEYFGFQRIVACLSSNYIGEAFSHGYAVDPVTGKELDIEFDLEIEPEEISEIYAYKKVNYDEMRRALGTLLAAWSELDVERAMSNAVEDALKFAGAECGVKSGDILSDEQAAKFARVFTDRLEPFLLHVVSGRKFSAEDMQKIAERLKEKG